MTLDMLHGYFVKVIWFLCYFQAYPRIDTQQLDTQIKSIMQEVLPVLREHFDNVCSQQLLLFIKRRVLSLARRYCVEACAEPQCRDYVSYFLKQLGSILQNSMSKFEGKK